MATENILWYASFLQSLESIYMARKVSLIAGQARTEKKCRVVFLISFQLHIFSDLFKLLEFPPKDRQIRIPYLE